MSRPMHRWNHYRFGKVLGLLPAIVATGCFQAPIAADGQVRSYVSTKIAVASVEREGREVSQFDPNLSVPQKIAASSASLSGTAVTIEPGALAIAADIVIEEAASLKETGVLNDLGLQGDVTVQKEGTPVIIRPTENAVLLKPMALEIPAPALGLVDRLFSLVDDSAYENMVVMYRVWKDGSAGMVSGVLTRSEISIVNGAVRFSTQSFGAFQAVILDKKMETSVEKPTSEPILNVNNVKVVDTTGVVSAVQITYAETRPEVVWNKPTISVDATSRSVKVVASYQGDFTMSSCQITLRQDPSQSPMYFVDSGSSLSAEVKISQTAETPLYAGIKCVDQYARGSFSPLSDKAVMPAYVAPKTDASTSTSTASQSAVSPLTFMDVPPEVYAGSVIKLGAMGGVAPYTYSLVSGGGSLKGDSYTAPNTPTKIQLRVTDAKGTKADHYLNVIPIPINMTFSPMYVSAMGVSTVSIIGGVPPYSITYVGPYENYSGTLNLETMVYTADGMAGNVTFTVTDSLGNIGMGILPILAQLSFYPMPNAVKAGGTAILDDVMGGLAPFTFAVPSGIGTISKNGMNQWVYQAPGTPGNVEILVTDATGATAYGSIEVLGSGRLDPEFGNQYNDFGTAYLYMPGHNSGSEESVRRLGRDPSGNILVGGWGNYCCTIPDIDAMGIVSFSPNASTQNSIYGVNGQAFYDGTQSSPVYNQVRTQSMYVAPDGTSYLVGHGTYIDQDVIVSSFNSSGMLHSGFSDDGVLALNPIGSGTGMEGRDIAPQTINGQDYLLVAARNILNHDVHLMRIDLAGNLDTTFGTGGYAMFLASGYVNDILVQSDGRIRLVGKFSGEFGVLCLEANGAKETAMGTNGMLTQTSGGGSANRVLQKADGGFLVVGSRMNISEEELFAVSYTSLWALDTGFGSGGLFSLDATVGSAESIRAAGQLIDGSIILGGVVNESYSPQAMVMKLSAAGVPDANFGTNGNGIANLGYSVSNGIISDILIQNDSAGYRIIGLVDHKTSGYGHVIGITP